MAVMYMHPASMTDYSPQVFCFAL